jgi:hypothetical protein
MKLGDIAFKLAAAGAMALTVAGCGQAPQAQVYNPEAAAPQVPTAAPVRSLERLTDQQIVPYAETDGVYRMTLEGQPYGRDGDIPCAVVLYRHATDRGWGSMSCDWDAAPRVGAAAPAAAAPAAAPVVGAP